MKSLPSRTGRLQWTFANRWRLQRANRGDVSNDAVKNMRLKQSGYCENQQSRFKPIVDQGVPGFPFVSGQGEIANARKVERRGKQNDMLREWPAPRR